MALAARWRGIVVAAPLGAEGLGAMAEAKTRYIVFWLGVIVLLAGAYVWWLSLAALRFSSGG